MESSSESSAVLRGAMDSSIGNGGFLRKSKSWLYLLVDEIVTKRIAPNFILAHYCYILTFIITCSVLLYFICNESGMKYIDILFFCSSATTQAGLSTMATTDLSLFQQIVLYFACMFTTPIFIHGSVVFIRLFWYEKRFKDIQTTSIEKYKMRRTHTISQLRAGLSRSNTNQNIGSKTQGYDLHDGSRAFAARIQDYSNSDSSGPVGLTHSPDIKFGDLPKSQKRRISSGSNDVLFTIKTKIEHNDDDTDDDTDDDGGFPFSAISLANLDFTALQLEKSNNLSDVKLPGRYKLRKRRSKLANKRKLNQSTQIKEDINIKPLYHKPSTPFDETEVAYPEVNPKNSVNNSVKLTRAHTIQVIPNSNKHFRNNILPRSLTSVDWRQGIDGEVNDDQLLAYATRRLGIRPNWGLFSRNSNVIPLTKQQREELGGVEYQAMKILGRLVYGYYFGFLLFSLVFLIPFIIIRKDYVEKLAADGCDRPIWWAFFTICSGFANEGLAINGSSFELFAQNIYILIFFVFLMLSGNTAFPINMRILVWIIRYFTKPSTMMYDSLTFLLDHPRRCFTLMFPSSATWWLFFVIILLNCVDWILFIILDIGRDTLSYLPTGYRVFDGLFQAISSRTTGFNVFDLADLDHAVQLAYVVMMYIAALPIAISIKSTNIYEDQSLAVYTAKEEFSFNRPKKDYITAHLRVQLSSDLWFIFLAIFIICIVEHRRLDAGDINFTIFQIIFEVVSAYGTVGLSLGYPNNPASFTGEFHVLSKLLVMAVMIRGRHRCLPNSLDRSIMLPGDKLDKVEETEREISIGRSNAMVNYLHEEAQVSPMRC